MTSLEIAGLGKSWGSVNILKDLSLSVASGEFISLLGPSGCGKTTILRIIAGLIEPDKGQISLGDAEITWKPPYRRDIGFVFQSYALFPHLTVAENVAFGLRRRGLKGTSVATRVTAALDSVRLGHLAERYPRALSGGQQQRVALARATVIEPKLLLLDEPLSNLDAVLRAEMGMEIKRLQRELGITTVFVTHDQVEALTMSDRICLLNHGTITQLATPEQIYRKPESTFVATFIGRSNILKATVTAFSGGRIEAELGEGGGLLAGRGDGPPGAAVTFSLRQQAVSLTAADVAIGRNRLAATVSFATFAGPVRHYVLCLDAGPEIVVEAPDAAGAGFVIGDRVVASWAEEDLVLVKEDGVFR